MTLVFLSVCRYQPEHLSVAYEMANSQEEPEMAESFNEGTVDMLPQPEDRFTLKNLLWPASSEPTRLSGLAVNICTCLLGEM